MKRKSSILANSFIIAIIFSSCNTKTTNSSTQNDIMIHQLRVELEEIKHHIHTTVMQMNILTNKMVNSEDTLFELKQRDIITQKQTLENNKERLEQLEKKLETVIAKEDHTLLSINQIEEKLDQQILSIKQNKKKIQEVEQYSISVNDSNS